MPWNRAAIAMIALLSMRLPASEGDSSAPSYVLSIELNGTMRAEGQPDVPVNSKTEIHYRCLARGELLAMYQISNYYKYSIAGKLVQEASADKDKLTEITAAGKRETLVSTEPDKFRDFVAASFEQPICVLTLDGDGKAQKVALPESPISKEPQTQDLAKNLQYFHAMFSEKQDHWEQERTLVCGELRLTGTVKYQKKPPSGAQPKEGINEFPVEVSGALTTPMTGKNGDKMTLNFALSGEQTYDRKAKQWIAGKHEYKFTSTADPANKVPASYAGTVVVTLTQVK